MKSLNSIDANCNCKFICSQILQENTLVACYNNWRRMTVRLTRNFPLSSLLVRIHDKSVDINGKLSSSMELLNVMLMAGPVNKEQRIEL